MQSLYYATFAAGLECAVDGAASQWLRGYSRKRTLSGALLYSADAAKPDMPCFQNLYWVAAQYAGEKSAARAGATFLKDRRALQNLARGIEKYRLQSLRVMFSEENTLVRPDAALRGQLERMLPVSVNRVNPESELLILRRSEGFALILLRLPRDAAPRVDTARGALSPALSAAMIMLARPGRDGRFLDPFAGHGTLGQARAALGEYQSMTLGELDGALADALRRSAPPRARVTRMDAFEMEKYVPDGSVNELVTDPPWGEFQPLPRPEAEYDAAMLACFARALAPYGMLVVLTSRKQAFERALRANPAFAPRGRFDILVNGKKAAIFVAQRA